MDTPPTPQEAEESLRQIRRQQADAIRSGGRTQWWFILGLSALFAAYGLSKDLHSPMLQTILFVAFFVGVFALIWASQRRAPIRYQRSWTLRHYDWLLTLGMVGFVLAPVAVLFAGPIALEALGAPMPHTLSGVATGLFLLLAAWPFNRWYIRRFAQRVEAQER